MWLCKLEIVKVCLLCGGIISPTTPNFDAESVFFLPMAIVQYVSC